MTYTYNNIFQKSLFVVRKLAIKDLIYIRILSINKNRSNKSKEGN